MDAINLTNEIYGIAYFNIRAWNIVLLSATL